MFPLKEVILFSITYLRTLPVTIEIIIAVTLIVKANIATFIILDEILLVDELFPFNLFANK